MNRLKIIAFTHKNHEIGELKNFFIEEAQIPVTLASIKRDSGLDEIWYLATCNRIEFVFVTNEDLTVSFTSRFLKSFNPQFTSAEIQKYSSKASLFQGESAIEHLLNVASSLDSLVVGEREILAQVRKSYGLAKDSMLTGDLLRLVDKITVKTAKEVFTETCISQRSVSVVFLAYNLLKELSVKLDARFLIIGAGQTNGTMAKYLLKHGFKNFVVFNRTMENGRKLAKELNGVAYPLSELGSYQGGFDVIISCTGASQPILTQELYANLLVNDSSKKVLIDLAVPADISPEISSGFNTHLIKIENLRALAAENLKEREKELEAAKKIVAANIEEFKNILKHRQVEIAMRSVPERIKEIKETAVTKVFAREIEQLDEASKEVLDKVLSYFEKKCISVPMTIAKDILIEE